MVIAVLIAVGWGSTAVDSGPSDPGPATSRQTSGTPRCRPEPLAGVHDPTRLKILHACATFVGTVVRAPKLNPSDRDVTFNASPDRAYASMLNDKNRKERGLHIEVIPMDQPGCKAGQPITNGEGDLGVCSGANVVFPPLGAHVRVTGAHVYDSWVGWNEIHPVWKVEILPPTGPPPPEVLLLKARLTGKAVGRKGARHGSGRVALALSAGKVCWRFSRLAGIGRPRRATVRAGGPLWIGPILLTLGSRYTARGCASADAGRLKPLMEKPRSYYVTVVTPRYRPGAIRGQLTPAAD
jgi:hypothetical protein